MLVFLLNLNITTILQGSRSSSGLNTVDFMWLHDIFFYMKKWIQAIRRDEGKDLKISDSTKVCSRHFRDEDLRACLHGDGGPQVGEVTRLAVVEK